MCNHDWLDRDLLGLHRKGDLVCLGLLHARVVGALPDEERAQVELWMLEDPQFHEQVRQAELMLTSFSQLENSASASIHPIKSETPHETRTSFKQWIAQPMSMAATVLLAVAATLLIRGESQLTDGVSLSNGLALNAVTTLQSTRSAGTEIQLSGDTQLLQIDVGISLDDAPYQVVLTHEDGNPRFEFQLHADANYAHMTHHRINWCFLQKIYAGFYQP